MTPESLEDILTLIAEEWVEISQLFSEIRSAQGLETFLLSLQAAREELEAFSEQ